MQDILSYAISPFLLEGALLALEITVLAMIGGLALGLVLATMRLSAIAPLRWIAAVYIWFIRGTPVLLQLVFVYDVLPQFGIKLDNFTTAVIGFALHESAFAAEYLRGGILSVDRSQTVAASALGMGPILTLHRIVLPQAMRAILPQIGNSLINLLKTTSVASVIFVNELAFRAQQVAGLTFEYVPVLTAAGIIYLMMTSVVALGQDWLERRFNTDLDRKAKWTIQGELRRFFGRAAPAAMPGAPKELRLVKPVAAPHFDPALIRRLVGEEPHAAVNGDGAYVACRNVQKSYGAKEILRGIDLGIARGEVVALLGPSGSGKSTLLRLINHLEQLDWGEITVDGRYVGYEKTGTALKPQRHIARARAAARIGMVFQHFNLFGHLTALENIIEAPIRVYGKDPKDARALGVTLLESIGLADFADHLPHRLSGGQQQRVAIARALAISPRLMLFDEPTSALDPEIVGEVLSVIRDLALAGMTMLVVTHEIRFARSVADRVVFMDQGEIVEQGTAAQVIDAPQHERTQRFLRFMEQKAVIEPATETVPDKVAVV